MPSDLAIRSMIDDYITRLPAEPDAVAKCAYCKEDLHEGEEVTVYSDEYFCCDDHLIEYLREQHEVWTTVLERDA